MSTILRVVLFLSELHRRLFRMEIRLSRVFYDIEATKNDFSEL